MAYARAYARSEYSGSIPYTWSSFSKKGFGSLFAEFCPDITTNDACYPSGRFGYWN